MSSGDGIMSDWEYKLARHPRTSARRAHNWFVMGCPKVYAGDPAQVWTVLKCNVSEREARVYLTEMTTPEPLVSS